MPFGTMLPFTQTYGGENSYQNPTLSNPSKKRFTSYDRSDVTGLHYAVNRSYSSEQGRFTQVDPIEMDAASLSNPQTLNLYAYCGNDPINHVDPAGTSFFGKLFGWIGKIFKWVAIAAIVAVAVLTVVGGAWAGTVLAKIFIWSIHHPILASLIGLHSPQWAIINLASREGATAAGFWVAAGVGAVSSFQQGAKQKKTEEKEQSKATAWVGPFIASNVHRMEGADVIPNSKGRAECVELTRSVQLDNGGYAPPSWEWRPGPSVLDHNNLRSIKWGTAVATFENGRFQGTRATGQHSGFYLGPTPDGEGFLLLEQFPGLQNVQIRSIRPKAGRTDPPNNARCFNVIYAEKEIDQ